MILPTKRLSPSRSLMFVGADILRNLDEAKTVSRMWTEIRSERDPQRNQPLTFDWFVLALDLLFLAGAIDLHDGRLVRVHK